MSERETINADEHPAKMEAGRGGQVQERRAPMLSSWLAYLYSPILPLLEKVTIRRSGPREHNPADILLPDGYEAEVVAIGFNAPVHCTFDDQGFCYVIEAGHKIEARPRVLKVNVHTGLYETYFEWPEAQWKKTGAVTGGCWHNGYLYLMNTDTLYRVAIDGSVEEVLTGLPGKGDHQSNYPIPGPDGKLYFGQGSATNTGIVGADNFAYEWLPKFPDVHDIPGADVTLAGRNYRYQNVLDDVTQTIQSGAYVPFGTETGPGQVIKGAVACNGAVLRCNPDGSGLELVAWGLRNPYGIAFHPDGRLFVTEHGIDERSGRYILNDPDDFYEIQDGAWYGWPDFAAGIRLDDPYWGEGGQGREPVLAEHPDPNPLRPLVTFTSHSGANGFDFCRDPDFGFEGDAFVACFGDLAPITTLSKALEPAGFKVVRVDMKAGRVVDFAVNKMTGPASRLPHSGFERPSHCQFGPDGALYVVDWGAIRIAPEKGGIRMQEGTGTLWRIRRRTGLPHSDQPPPPQRYPAAGLLSLLGVAAAAAVTMIAAWSVRRLVRRRRNGDTS